MNSSDAEQSVIGGLLINPVILAVCDALVLTLQVKYHHVIEYES